MYKTKGFQALQAPSIFNFHIFNSPRHVDGVECM